MYAKPLPHHEQPLQIGRDSWLIRELDQKPDEPVGVYVNSLVIRGSEPMIVDTGTPGNREQWLADAWSIVDPEDVRWVYLSHDDYDHSGNLVQVLEACPNATLITNWLAAMRMGREFDIPLPRMRWMNAGEHLDIGDRTIAAIRPPLYDSPVTHGLFDSRTGLYWASDCFGQTVPGPTDDAAEIADEDFDEAQRFWSRLLSPWVSLVDHAKFSSEIKRVRSLGMDSIANAHGPVITGTRVDRAFEILGSVPSLDPVRYPGQEELEATIARIHAPAAAAPAE